MEPCPKHLWLLAALCLVADYSHAQSQARLRRVAKDASNAVANISVWPKPDKDAPFGTVGTAFFINDDGYFVTANHVLDLPPDAGYLTVTIRQTDGGGAGLWFDIIERDGGHDVALCRAKNYEAYRKSGPVAKRYGFPGFVLGSLRLSETPPILGTIIALPGFPLGSWNPTVQFGTLAATETINPNVSGVPKGRRFLLQVAVVANQGNSGSPVIDVNTGEVVGIVIQAIPAPLFAVSPTVPVAQSSGIALAVPAKWAVELARKNGVPTERKSPSHSK